MIIYQDENYELWDAHTHFSNLISKRLKFILKYLSTYETMDLIFNNWKIIKKSTKNRIERNISFYINILDYYKIDRAVHLPVFKFDRKLSYKMNELHPNRIFGFSNINPKSKTLDDDLEELVKLNIPGIKLHPDFMRFTFKSHSEELIKIFNFCGENNIIILSHTGSHSRLLNIGDILKKSDDTIFIMGHSGLAPQVDDALEIARQFPNSYLEMSGNPYTYKFIEAIKDPNIGIERILFGTDIPSLNPRIEIEKVLSLPISSEERRMIFCENLKNIFKQINRIAS
ncbi:MAG: amidohydrolase family protein [Promethearchaeia archaeon]